MQERTATWSLLIYNVITLRKKEFEKPQKKLDKLKYDQHQTRGFSKLFQSK